MHISLQILVPDVDFNNILTSRTRLSGWGKVRHQLSTKRSRKTSCRGQHPADHPQVHEILEVSDSESEEQIPLQDISNRQAVAPTRPRILNLSPSGSQSTNPTLTSKTLPQSSGHPPSQPTSPRSSWTQLTRTPTPQPTYSAHSQSTYSTPPQASHPPPSVHPPPSAHPPSPSSFPPPLSSYPPPSAYPPPQQST